MTTSVKEGIRHPVTTVHHLFEAQENGHSVHNWTPLRAWAAQNAYTLIFLALLFVITWTIQILSLVIG